VAAGPLDSGSPRTSHSGTCAGSVGPRSACARTARRATSRCGLSVTARRESIAMEPRKIAVELLPQERAALLRGNFTIDDVLEQLEACASSLRVETILFTATDVHFLTGDLTHAIVKRGCRDADVIELSERMDYVD